MANRDVKECGSAPAWCEPSDIDEKAQEVSACLLAAWMSCSPAEGSLGYLVMDETDEAKSGTLVHHIFIAPGPVSCEVTVFEVRPEDSVQRVYREACTSFVMDSCGIVRAQSCGDAETIAVDNRSLE